MNIKVKISVIILAVGILGIILLDQVNHPKISLNLSDAATQAGWTLSWSDEFDGTLLDTSKWIAVNNCGDQRNNEQQCYMADDVSVNGGYLNIKSEKRNQSGFAYTSGAVRTGTKFARAYGRFEFRAQLPVGGQGVWPALWLTPNNQWPPEIDVLEAVNSMSDINMTYHWGTTSNHQQDGSAVHISNPEAFHTYAMEWESSAIRWYIDGNLVKTHSGPDVTNVAMQLYINTALGGAWPGPVSAGTVFPQNMLVDYVRVYTQGTSPTPTPTSTITSTPTPTITPTPTPILGDINKDHIVNSLDWSVMNVKWFTSDTNCDLNKDGIVNSLDFSVLNSNWFKTW